MALGQRERGERSKMAQEREVRARWLAKERGGVRASWPGQV
jgi:hypothetical protein